MLKYAVLVVEEAVRSIKNGTKNEFTNISQRRTLTFTNNRAGYEVLIMRWC